MFAVSLDPRQHPYVTLALLVTALIVGVAWSYRVVRDLYGDPAPRGDAPEDLLTPLAEAFAAGQMSEEEYQRIRASVARVAGLDDPRMLFVKGAGPVGKGREAPEPPPAAAAETEPEGEAAGGPSA